MTTSTAIQIESAQWVEICSEADLIPESGVAALLGNEQVAIYYLPDEAPQVYALDNFDPFSGANVLSRGILGDLKGRLVVASPVYKQHFELVSGVCLEDAAKRVKTWPVKLEDGKVFIAA